MKTLSDCRDCNLYSVYAYVEKDQQNPQLVMTLAAFFFSAPDT